MVNTVAVLLPGARKSRLGFLLPHNLKLLGCQDFFPFVFSFNDFFYHFIVGIPRYLSRAITRDPGSITLFWISACAGMTKNILIQSNHGAIFAGAAINRHGLWQLSAFDDKDFKRITIKIETRAANGKPFSHVRPVVNHN